MGHKIVAAGASAALAVSGLMGMAAPAQAAETITFCFLFPNGTAWSGLPVGVQAYAGNGWERAGEVSVGDAYGCAKFTLPGGYNKVTVRGYAEYYHPDGFGGIAYAWTGFSEVATPGIGEVHVGTSYVTCTPVTRSCP